MYFPALQTLALKQILSLPPALLRFICGGGVVHIDGRTLDTQIQFLWRTYLQDQNLEKLSFDDKPLETIREEWRQVAQDFGPAPELKLRFDTLDANSPLSTALSGLMPVGGLLIRPHHPDPAMPLLVFFHEGAGLLGGPELSKAFCALLAHEARCPIFLPAYRLAPEHRFPAALDDARLAYDWAVENAVKLGAASGQVSVGGVSMGGNLAARLCLNLKREFKPLPKGQLLISPLLDLSDDRLIKNPYKDVWPIRGADLDRAIKTYAGAGVDLKDPRLSPLLETVIVGQPKSLIIAAGLDPLAAQAEAYVHRLLEARTDVIYRRFDTLPHGFGLFVSLVEGARQAGLDIAQEWVSLLNRP